MSTLERNRWLRRWLLEAPPPVRSVRPFGPEDFGLCVPWLWAGVFGNEVSGLVTPKPLQCHVNGPVNVPITIQHPVDGVSDSRKVLWGANVSGLQRRFLCVRGVSLPGDCWRRLAS